MNDLKNKKCLPCEGGVSKLSDSEIDHLLLQVPGWLGKGMKISRKFVFKNFAQAMVFVNKMADIAEQEGHHPDFLVHYNEVTVTLWTHAVGGLTENDFILAAKINQIS